MGVVEAPAEHRQLAADGESNIQAWLVPCTGVEFAGTLRDFVRGDLARKYPELMGDVEGVLLQSAQSILTQFSAGLQDRALETFRKTGVSVRTGVRVIAITQDQV